MTDEVLESLDNLDACPLPDSEKAAIRFAEVMTTNADSVDIEALREHYNDDQIVEMACVIGMFNYLNRFAEAMGLWPTRPGEGGPDDVG